MGLSCDVINECVCCGTCCNCRYGLEKMIIFFIVPFMILALHLCNIYAGISDHFFSSILLVFLIKSSQPSIFLYETHFLLYNLFLGSVLLYILSSSSFQLDLAGIIK